jgi:hypothetical protein
VRVDPEGVGQRWHYERERSGAALRSQTPFDLGAQASQWSLGRDRRRADYPESEKRGESCGAARC